MLKKNCLERTAWKNCLEKIAWKEPREAIRRMPVGAKKRLLFRFKADSSLIDVSSI